MDEEMEEMDEEGEEEELGEDGTEMGTKTIQVRFKSYKQLKTYKNSLNFRIV